MDFNQDQILSIHLSTLRLSQHVLSIHHLESLVIGPMEVDILMSLLFNLSRLFSLSIDI
jgi:hypothetical protein